MIQNASAGVQALSALTSHCTSEQGILHDVFPFDLSHHNTCTFQMHTRGGFDDDDTGSPNQY